MAVNVAKLPELMREAKRLRKALTEGSSTVAA